jgi:HPt (histidine-containing phosphotransfer) domain-containing protein
MTSNATSTSSSPAPVLDARALARLRELDPGGEHGVVARVLAIYDVSLRRMLGQLEADRGGSNASSVLGIAHALKSSSASVGALGMAAACTAVEARLRAGDHGTLQRDIDLLIAEGQAALLAVAAALVP